MTGARPHHSRPAFTLVEAVISSVVVATMFVAAVAVIGSSARARRLHAGWARADALGRSLMAEITQSRYAEPAGSRRFGPEADEPSRAEWDDADDYSAFTQSPPTDKDGKVIPGADGWSWRATVEQVRPDDPATSTGDTDTDTGLRLISVTVISPDGKPRTLIALRSAFGAAEHRPPTVGIEQAALATVTLTLKGSSRAASASAPILNLPEP